MLPPKPAFGAVPPAMVADLCRLAGAQAVIAGTTMQGGFSAAAAFKVTFDNGVTLAVKGAHPGDQSHAAQALRDEVNAYAALPLLKDISPAYIGTSVDDSSNDDGWWLGAWQWLERGQPSANDRARAARGLLSRMADTAENDMTALPVALAHPYLKQFFTADNKWRRIADDALRAEKFDRCFVSPQAATAWRNENITVLLQAQEYTARTAFVLGLMHGDLRCDNLFYGAAAHEDPHWWIIDWVNAAEGPLVFDRVMLAASLLAAGDISAEDAIDFAACEDTAVPPAHVMTMAASMAGYFAEQMYRAVPAAMPALRDIQRAMFWALCHMLYVGGVIKTAPPALVTTACMQQTL